MSKRRTRIQIVKTFSIVLGVLPVLLLMMSIAASSTLSAGDRAPDFTLQDTSNANFSLDSLKDKIVIIVFWRSDQERSVQALIALQAIYAEFKDQGVEVLAISSDEGGLEPINKIKQSRQLTFIMLYDKEQKAYGDYGVIAIPTTLIIDKEGKLSHYYAGYRNDFSRQIRGRVEVLLGKKTIEQLEAELHPVKKPEVSESEKKARRYLNTGNRLLEKGMTRSAMKQYQKAAQEESALFEPHLCLGDIYLAQKKVEEATVEFKQAIDLKPNSAEAHSGMGGVLLLQGQLDKAVEMLQIALKLNPKLAKAHYGLGKVYEEQKRIEDALKEYKIALRILLKIEE